MTPPLDARDIASLLCFALFTLATFALHFYQRMRCCRCCSTRGGRE